MANNRLIPDYIFETSWEVCNKVGGIYTVLSTRANTLQSRFKDRVIFIGPDLGQNAENSLFIDDPNVYRAWKKQAIEEDKLGIRVGRWDIPGQPVVILVDFQPYFAEKNEIYFHAWEDFGVDSLHAYGDYDEASMFSYAAAKVVESFCRFYISENDKVIYQAHEWMTGLGALYLQKNMPQVATIFTTHATSIGRSIAGNNKPLYDYLFAYDGDQMAAELNMDSKHSIEKQTAHHVDCFTTVSEITNQECRELLDKEAAVVLMNGFENGFVPKGTSFLSKRRQARKAILSVANALLGEELGDDTLIVGTSGRYEFQNKGIDVFLESMNRLNNDPALSKNVLALVTVPGWIIGPREDLQERLSAKKVYDTPLEYPFVTHALHDIQGDRLLGMLHGLNLHNQKSDKVKLIFMPCYLDGNDGILNKSYYDYLIGLDLTIYPSYYEPWGYTPLESVAFHVPTVTTDLAGFGLWVKTLESWNGLSEGVAVVHRSDYNYFEVAEETKNYILTFSHRNESEVKMIRKKAVSIAEKALWKHFIEYYYEAYDVALRGAEERLKSGWKTDY